MAVGGSVLRSSPMQWHQRRSKRFRDIDKRLSLWQRLVCFSQLHHNLFWSVAFPSHCTLHSKLILTLLGQSKFLISDGSLSKSPGRHSTNGYFSSITLNCEGQLIKLRYGQAAHLRANSQCNLNLMPALQNERKYRLTPKCAQKIYSPYQS